MFSVLLRQLSYLVMVTVTVLGLGMSEVSLIAKAAQAEVLNIYSARTAQLIEPLLDAYTQETGVEFKILHLSKGMAQRLAAEGDDTPADIVLTVDTRRGKNAQNAA